MKQITPFMTGVLIAVSVSIIMNLPEYEAPDPAPDYGYNEPGYTIEKMIDGWCAGRVIRRGFTYEYEATYCAGEFGRVPVNIPHTDSPDWDSTFVRMIQEVDSLAGVGR